MRNRTQYQYPTFYTQETTTKKERKPQVRISISFREDEMWMYEKITEHSSPSAWIKDLLKEYYKEHDK